MYGAMAAATKGAMFSTSGAQSFKAAKPRIQQAYRPSALVKTGKRLLKSDASEIVWAISKLEQIWANIHFVSGCSNHISSQSIFWGFAMYHIISIEGEARQLQDVIVTMVVIMVIMIFPVAKRELRSFAYPYFHLFPTKWGAAGSYNQSFPTSC